MFSYFKMFALVFLHSSKHFIDKRAFQDHVKGKPHKRRLHALETEPYTIASRRFGWIISACGSASLTFIY